MLSDEVLNILTIVYFFVCFVIFGGFLCVAIHDLSRGEVYKDYVPVFRRPEYWFFAIVLSTPVVNAAIALVSVIWFPVFEAMLRRREVGIKRMHSAEVYMGINPVVMNSEKLHTTLYRCKCGGPFSQMAMTCELRGRGDWMLQCCSCGATAKGESPYDVILEFAEKHSEPELCEDQYQKNMGFFSRLYREWRLQRIKKPFYTRDFGPLKGMYKDAS